MYGLSRTTVAIALLVAITSALPAPEAFSASGAGADTRRDNTQPASMEMECDPFLDPTLDPIFQEQWQGVRTARSTVPFANSMVNVSPSGETVFAAKSALAAWDADTLALLWQGPTQDQDFARLASDGKRVYGLRSDSTVIAYDAATGTEAWRTMLELPGLVENDRFESHERTNAIAASPDGRRLYVTGRTALVDRLLGRRITNEDVIAAAFDAATGQRLWVTTWGTIVDFEYGLFLEVSSDGKTLFVGGREGGTPDVDPIASEQRSSYLALAFRAWDPNNPEREGKILWDSEYDGGGGQKDPVGMDLAPNGNRLYLTGRVSGTGPRNGDIDYGTVAFRTTDGNQDWAARFEGGTTSFQDSSELFSVRDLAHEARSVKASPDGSKVFVTGSTTSRTVRSSDLEVSTLTKREYGTVAYSAQNGEQVWATVCAGPGQGSNAQALSVDVSSDGRAVYVAGDRGTIAYDADTSNQIWTAPGASRQAVTVGEESVVVATANSLAAYDA